MAPLRCLLMIVLYLVVSCLLVDALVRQHTIHGPHDTNTPKKGIPVPRETKALARWPRHRPLSQEQKMLVRQRLHGSFKEEEGKEEEGESPLKSLQQRSQNVSAAGDLQESGIICPAADMIRPCVCDPMTLTLDCSLEIDMLHLYTIFHETTFVLKSFNFFIMSHDSTVVPSGHHYDNILMDETFAGVSFIEIYIANTNLTKVEPNAFVGSEESLRKLSLRRNLNLSIFPFNKLQNFNKMEELQVTDGSLSRVETFGPMQNLHLIHLYSNQIHYIEAGAFAGAPNLELIDLAFNELTTMTAGSLGLSSSVASVWIDNNKISFINDYAFDQNLPILLDVSSNQLTTLKERVFKPILDIMISTYDYYVNAMDNPIDCSKVKWICENPAYINHLYMPPCPEMMPR